METPNLPPDESGAVAAPPSLGNCLVNVIAAPGEVFERLRPARARVATWLVPGLILLLVSWIGTAIIFSQDSVKQQISDMQEKGLQQQVEKGKMTQDQVNQAREMTSKFGRIFMMVIVYGTSLLGAFVTPFWWGFLLWLIGVKILKGSCPYLKAVEVAGLANMIGVLTAILKTLLILVTGNLFAGLNPALLISGFDASNSLHSALVNLDLMTFWVLLVYGLGIAKVSGVSTGKAVGWTLGFWVLITGSLVGIGLLAQSVFGR
jgi:hypothetical protein